MSRADLTDLLERGAGPAPHGVDTSAVWRRGRRRRSMKRLTAAAGVAAVIAAVVVVQPFSGGPTRGISIAPADRPSSAELTDVVAVGDSEVVRLAAAPTDDDSLKDAVVTDADGLRALWRLADIDGEPPTLPDGTVGIFVIARQAESTCRSPADIAGVKIDNGVAVVLLDPDGEFLRPCPGPQGSGAWTAFAVAIPDHYDQGLTGASSRLAAADNPTGDTSDQTDDGESALRPDLGDPQQAQLTGYAATPFPHGFVVFSTDERGHEWCVVSYLGERDDMSGMVGPQDCQWRFSVDEMPYDGPAQPMGSVSGADAGIVVWGIQPRPEPGESMDLTVLFDEQPSNDVRGGTGGGVPFLLWSAGHPGPAPETIEIRQAAGTVATIAWPPLDEDAWGAQQLRPSSLTPEEAFAGQLTEQTIDDFTDEQLSALNLHADDDFYSLSLEGTDRAVGIHVPDGANPVMFATSCDVLNEAQLPAGWDGWCLEYIDAEEGLITGVFPYGTTSR